MRFHRPRPILLVALASAMILAGCTSRRGGDRPGPTVDGGGGGPVDPRCAALCADDEPACSADVEDCRALCQIRVASMAPACATCLLDGANGGSCSPGVPCCPDPEFPAVTACAERCAGSVGTNPASHPICEHLCSSAEPDCASAAASCRAECQARIAGVSGLCALCLLDGANGGSCDPGVPCCPDPEFPTGAETCSPFCG